MRKLFSFIFLFSIYVGYSMLVYTKGTEKDTGLTAAELSEVNKGKIIYQQYNCVACHQVYGLGGYLGPDLTNAYSDKNRGPEFMKALLKSGSERMPDFKLSEPEINALISYLKHVDASSVEKK